LADREQTSQKEVLTTGEVARICHVAPRTVSKWFDTGSLRGYRIPGSRDRRIPRKQLLAFMRANGIPLEGLDGGVCRILLVDPFPSAACLDALGDSPRCEFRTAENDFQAGLVAEQFQPHLVVLDVEGRLSDAAAMCRNIRLTDSLRRTRVVAAVMQVTENEGQWLRAQGFRGWVTKPYTAEQLLAFTDDLGDPSSP
jgi:excisionase family DNA binding protein